MHRGAAGLLLVITILTASAACAAADGRIDTAERYPTAHASTLIHVRGSSGQSIEGALISITYRPESRVEKSVSLGATNDAGIVRWTPEDAGVVTITAAWTERDSTAGTATSNISVKFDSTPPSGIAIMILAGLLLLGGSIIQFARLLREPDAA